MNHSLLDLEASAGPPVRLTAVGGIDHFTADCLVEFHDLMCDDGVDVDLDLGLVTFLDAGAIRALVRIYRRHVAAGTRARVVAGSPQVRRLLELCELESVLDLVADSAPDADDLLLLGELDPDREGVTVIEGRPFPLVEWSGC